MVSYPNFFVPEVITLIYIHLIYIFFLIRLFYKAAEYKGAGEDEVINTISQKNSKLDRHDHGHVFGHALTDLTLSSYLMIESLKICVF